MKHGTYNAYHNHGCRCEPCGVAHRDYEHARRERLRPAPTDPDALSDLLNEMFPLGLTDDCPARKTAA